MQLEMTESGGGVTGIASTVREAHLRELADGVLRRAARAPRPEVGTDPRVRELMRQVCDVAHERGLRAEQLILFLKDAWWKLPDVRRLPRHDTGEMLARTITVCIEEYFAWGDGPG